jgi:RNA polymerase sigma-70 factor, ECF subfamily
MRHAPTTRFSLLAKLGDAADQEAWLEFVRLYEPAIYRFARSRGLQDADAREVVQDVLLNVGRLASKNQTTELRSFRSWLAQVTRNRVIDLVRQRSYTRKEQSLNSTSYSLGALSSEGHRSIADYPTTIDREWQLAVRREWFHRAAQTIQSQIDPKQWQAFYQTAVEVQDPVLVANRLGMTIGNVYVARCRVIKKLRKLVESLSIDDGLDMPEDMHVEGEI